MTGQVLTQTGLGLDLIGAILLGIAATVTRRFLATYDGAPSPGQRLILNWTEIPGWIALGLGFALQFLGATT